MLFYGINPDFDVFFFQSWDSHLRGIVLRILRDKAIPEAD